MDYFNYVFTTFLGLDSGSAQVVKGGADVFICFLNMYKIFGFGTTWG